jgi:hypothetical protein
VWESDIRVWVGGPGDALARVVAASVLAAGDLSREGDAALGGSQERLFGHVGGDGGREGDRLGDVARLVAGADLEFLRTKEGGEEGVGPD